MTFIQIFLVIFVAFALFGAITRFRRGGMSSSHLVLWSLLWIAVGVVAVRPETTSVLARFVGVGRGADLIVYLALLALFYLQFRQFAKIEKLEREITAVVRKDAIDKLNDGKDVR